MQHKGDWYWWWFLTEHFTKLVREGQLVTFNKIKTLVNQNSKHFGQLVHS